MFRNFKPLLASGLAALFIAAAPAIASTPPDALPAAQTDDGTITQAVKAALETNESLAGAEISIQTTQGEVYLSGYVGNPADIQTATELAQGVAGVTSVKNELKTR